MITANVLLKIFNSICLYNGLVVQHNCHRLALGAVADGG